MEEAGRTNPAQRWHATAPPLLFTVTLTVVAAACAGAALTVAARHLLAACDGVAVPGSHFVLAFAGLLGSGLSVVLYAVARVRAPRGGGRTGGGRAGGPGRAGLVTAVCAVLVMAASALALHSDYQQAEMVEAQTKGNVLIACTTG